MDGFISVRTATAGQHSIANRKLAVARDWRVQAKGWTIHQLGENQNPRILRQQDDSLSLRQ